jgi:hypothetical protein
MSELVRCGKHGVMTAAVEIDPCGRAAAVATTQGRVRE